MHIQNALIFCFRCYFKSDLYVQMEKNYAYSNPFIVVSVECSCF